jgi:hypothetical protein
MNTFLFNLLTFIVRRLINAQLFEHIRDMVNAQMDNNLTGEQKRAAVKQELTELTGALREDFHKTAPYLVNLAIESAVALIKK